MKTPADFRTQDDWLSYVRRSVPAEDINYTLALGRTGMFRRFYEMRNQPFPETFATELAQIPGLQEPERTQKLEELKDRIFADMIQFLFTAAAGIGSQESIVPTTPRELIDDLLLHLRTKNPYFALWAYYNSNVRHGEDAPEWDEFVPGSCDRTAKKRSSSHT